MPDVKEVADRVYRLETPIARMPGATVVYLIDEPGGALIEPGPAALIPVAIETLYPTRAIGKAVYNSAQPPGHRDSA